MSKKLLNIKRKTQPNEFGQMAKLTLRVYRDNIWDVFSVTGIIALGLIIGILITAPVIASLIQTTTAKIISVATSVVGKSGFDASAFMQSLSEQFKALNWNKPFDTIQLLLQDKGLYRIFIQALTDSGFQKEIIDQIKDTVAQCTTDLVNGITHEAFVMITSLAISSVVAFVSSRLVIQLRNSVNKNVGRFVASFFLNLFTVALVYFLIILCLVNKIHVAALIFIFIGIFLLLLVLTLIWATICYKNKKQKFTDIFNLKTLLKELISTLIVVAISALLFIIVYFINNVIGIIMAIPLILITNIIIESAVIKYAATYANEVK